MSSRPRNILFLWTDQQRPDSIGAYRAPGAPGPRTPHLDRLAATGALFERSYVAQPVCSPARASVLTGLYPHTHGVTSNSMVLPAEATTLAERLRPLGYACGYTGKWHLGQEHRAQRGFEDFWSSTEDYGFGYDPGDPAAAAPSHYQQWLIDRGYLPPGTTRPIGRPAAARLPEEACKPAFQAAECERFLETYRDRPFFLMCNFLEPHPPNFGPYDHMYDPDTIPLPESWYRDFEESVPLRFRLRRQYITGAAADGPLDAKGDKWRPSQLGAGGERGWREVIARYWGLCTLVDTYTGRILRKLEELGLTGETIVVYNSDHGDMMGDHQLLNKGLPYEGSATVPLLIRVPGLAARRLKTPASQVDLVPTLLDLLGLPAPERTQGKSLAPLLRDGDTAPDGIDVVLEWNGHDGYPAEFIQPGRLSADDDVERRLRAVEYRTIRRGRWKLTVHASGEHELYDLEEDPGELHNAYPDPDTRRVIETLWERLRAWQRATDDPVSLPEP